MMNMSSLRIPLVVGAALAVAVLTLLPSRPAGAQEPGPANLPGAAVTVMNPLYKRFQKIVPAVVHIEIMGTDEAWTTYFEGGQMKIVAGKFHDPMRIYQLSAEDLASIHEKVQDGALSFQEKLELLKLMIDACQTPVPPPEWATGSVNYRLTGWEEKLLYLGSLDSKLQLYLRKAQEAENAVQKYYWGGKAAITKQILTLVGGRADDQLWEEIDAALDRGDEQVVAGGHFDLLLNVLGIHLGVKALNFGSWRPLIENTIQRLNAEMLSLPDYPPGQAENRKKAIEAYLAPAKYIKDIMDEV